MRKSFGEVLDYCNHALDIIGKQELTGDEQKKYIEEVVLNFANHVNPGFLEYRKSASTDYTSIEWFGEGDHFRDLTGKEFIDCLGGYGTFNCGHRHPKIMKALEDQMKKQPLSSAELLDANRSMLCRILAEITPGDLQYTFFTSSGTEAVECALKMAALATGRHYFVTAKGDFHGKTHGSLSLTAKAAYRKPFLPMLQGVRHVPFNDIDYLKKTLEIMDYIGELPAAVILEPIQGENGVIIPSDDYFPKVRELCDQYDVLLVADEVQTGMGRTGKMFCVDHWNVAPDIMCLAKALGGGVMPISACVCTKRAFEGMFPNPFLHSTTTGGNPLACAAAIACIKVIIEEKLAERAAETGAYFLINLKKLQAKYPQLLTDVRGKGLMLAMQYVDDEKGYKVATELFKRGVLVAGTLINAKTIRIEPPLNISIEHVDQVLDRLDQSLATVAKGAGLTIDVPASFKEAAATQA